MDQSMSVKFSCSIAFAIIPAIISLTLPAKGLCLATESPRAVIDSLTPIAVMVFPMEYSYDAAGNTPGSLISRIIAYLSDAMDWFRDGILIKKKPNIVCT